MTLLTHSHTHTHTHTARSLGTETREEVVCSGKDEAVCARGIARASASPCAGGDRCVEAVARKCVGGDAVPRSSRHATVTVLEIGGGVRFFLLPPSL